MKYLNMRTNWGVETVDQLDPKDFNSRAEFKKELNRLVGEYSMAGMSVYISNRPDKTWKE